MLNRENMETLYERNVYTQHGVMYYDDNEDMIIHFLKHVKTAL